MNRMLWCIIFILGGWTSGLAQSAPRQGSGILYLKPSSLGVSFEGKFSPDSRVVVGTSVTDTVIYPDTELYLWDLHGVDPNGDFEQPEPTATYDLNDYIGNEFWSRQLAFSPDSQLLAIRLQTEILLLNIPDLTLQHRISWETYLDTDEIGQIEWSPDGNLLAIVDGSSRRVAVWDMQTSAITQLADLDLDNSGLSAEIFVFGDGWLIPLINGFMYCTSHLENCADYLGEVEMLDNSHQWVATGAIDQAEQPAILWKQAADGTFQPDPDYFADLAGQPYNFSPDGKYLMAMQQATASGGSDYAYWIVYDVETRKALYEIDSAPHWLGDSSYFMTWTALYHPSSAEPLTNLPENVVPESVWAESTPHWWQFIATSDNGKWYLLDLGGAGLVVPVIWE